MLNMKLSDLDKPVSEENGGSPPRAALVWMTEHQRDCSVGAHERMDNALGVPTHTDHFYFCRHCRCLYVEKP